MTNDPVMTWQSKVGFGTALPVTTQLEVLNFGLKNRKSIVRNAGLRGTRTNISSGSADGLEQTAGQVAIECRPDVLAVLLESILGGTKSGTTYPLGEFLTGYYWSADKVSKVHNYSSVFVNRATFQSSSGQPLTLQLDLIGTTHAEGNAGTFPAISGTLSVMSPFMHSDLSVVVDGVTYLTERFQLVVDNRLQPFYRNSKTPSFIKPTDRQISTSIQFGYSVAELPLWALATDGVAGTATYAYGNVSCEFAMDKMQLPYEDPELANRQAEIMRLAQFMVRGASPLSELVVTLDSTP